uniref:Uncharacterized protein n=1 Tax=Triticum urartu TaxID=4572 RepID=A0A8R7R262_TRIUA
MSSTTCSDAGVQVEVHMSPSSPMFAFGSTQARGGAVASRCGWRGGRRQRGSRMVLAAVMKRYQYSVPKESYLFPMADPGFQVTRVGSLCRSVTLYARRQDWRGFKDTHSGYPGRPPIPAHTVAPPLFVSN